MNTSVITSKISQFALLIIAVFLLTNCQKPPTPEFSYSPAINPEVGDSIFFINESLEALSFDWNFGNNLSSSDENPFTIYEESGDVEVTLTATNDAGSETITKSISINEPTILGFYTFAANDSSTLSDCEVWIYDNQTDYDALSEPQFLEISDNEGMTLFMNLEAQEYFVVAVKEEDNGVWLVGGKTNKVELNKGILYYLPCTFYPDESKKALGKRSMPTELSTLEFKSKKELLTIK